MNKAAISNKLKSFKELTILLIIIVLVIGISIKSPIFMTASNIKTTAIGLACNGIIAIGMTMALISGGFDLSVGSIMGLATCLVIIFSNQGMGIIMAVICALIICTLVGFINGILIGYIGLNPFITTLGVQQIVRGAVFVMTGGSSISLASGSGVDGFKAIGSTNLFGIPMIVLIFLILAIAGDFLTKRSSAAMKVFYIGSNSKAAILSGINMNRVKMLVYVLTAFLSAIAGILNAARFTVATSNTGSGAEMTVISAAVIGGASLSGGKGTVLGAVLGVVMLSIINNALVLFNVDVNWQSLISGVILIVAILIDELSHRRKMKA